MFESRQGIISQSISQGDGGEGGGEGPLDLILNPGTAQFLLVTYVMQVSSWLLKLQ